MTPPSAPSTLQWMNRPKPRSRNHSSRSGLGSEHRQTVRERVEPGLAVPLAQRRLHAEVHTIERGVQGRPIELARKADALLQKYDGNPSNKPLQVLSSRMLNF